jgi:lysophospholipase L1-like esterase
VDDSNSDIPYNDDAFIELADDKWESDPMLPNAEEVESSSSSSSSSSNNMADTQQQDDNTMQEEIDESGKESEPQKVEQNSHQQEEQQQQEEQEQEQEQEQQQQQIEEEKEVSEPPQQDQQQKPTYKPKMIFCYGDSLTFGWVPNDNNPHPYGPHLEAELNVLYSSASAKSAEETGIPATIVQSVGYPGMTAAAMLELVEQDQVGTCSIMKQVTDLSVMIILTGTNDLGQMTHDAIGQDPSTIDSDGTSNMIINFITKLHKKTLDCAESVGNNDLHILSIGIPGSDLQKKYTQVGSIAAAVNKGLSEFASSYTNGKIIYRDFPFEFEESDSKWGGDGLHLSSLGYDELGKVLAPEVKRILDIMYDV